MSKTDQSNVQDQMDRLAQKNTFFRVDGDPEGAYRTITAPFCENRAQVYLQQRYPGALVEVWGVDDFADYLDCETDMRM